MIKNSLKRISKILLTTVLLCQPIVCKAEVKLQDGVYPVTVESSSSMFNIVDGELTVKDGEMKAVITLSGKGYLKLFIGTGQEAEKASEEQFIPYIEDENGAYTYEIPVEALDEEFDCAAYSKKKEKWYDRTLIVHAEVKPLEYAKTDLKDGTYKSDVILNGGSGRATILTPTKIVVEDGKATAVIEWNSPNYAYMIVSNETFYPVNTEGNSVFNLPVTGWDEEVDVIANTTAMSQPHDINYKIKFVSDSITKESSNTTIIISSILILVVIAGIIIYVKRKKN